MEQSKCSKSERLTEKLQIQSNKSVETRQKKYSHPACYNQCFMGTSEGFESPKGSFEGVSPPNTPRLGARSPNRRKKHSLPNCISLPVPVINTPFEEGRTKLKTNLN